MYRSSLYTWFSNCFSLKLLWQGGFNKMGVLWLRILCVCEFCSLSPPNTCTRTRTRTRTSIHGTLGRGYHYTQQRECSLLHLFLFLFRLKLVFFMFLYFIHNYLAYKSKKVVSHVWIENILGNCLTNYWVKSFQIC